MTDDPLVGEDYSQLIFRSKTSPEIRPFLTTSEEGLTKYNIHEETRGFNEEFGWST